MIITKKYYDKLASVYNILDAIALKDFHNNFDVLKDRLSKIKQEEYNINDKVVIEHFDLEYYDKKILNFGLFIYNTMVIIKELDIPYFVFVFVTNHFGLQQQVDKILKNHPTGDRPKIIETIVNNQIYNSNLVENLPINAQDIKHAGLSMIGQPRIHRFALYNYLKNNNLLDSIKISIRGSSNRYYLLPRI